MDRFNTELGGNWFELFVASKIKSKFPEGSVLHDLKVHSRYLSLTKNHDYTTQIDLVTVLPCKIYVIEAKKWGYEIIGNRDDMKWTGKSNSKTFIENVSPIAQNMNHLRALRNLLRVNNYKLPEFESIVCVPDDTNIVSDCKEVMGVSQMLYKMDLDLLSSEKTNSYSVNVKYWTDAIAEVVNDQHF